MIELTPLDVRKKKGDFRRGLRGYEPAQVDDFLDVVADRLEAVVRDAASVHERVARLEQQVADYRDREKALTEALVTAQQMREDIRSQSTREVELIRKNAEQEADRIKADAVKSREREEAALQALRTRQIQFLSSYRSFLEQELSDLNAVARGIEAHSGQAKGSPTGSRGAPAGAPAAESRPVAPAKAPPAARTPEQPMNGGMATAAPAPAAGRSSPPAKGGAQKPGLPPAADEEIEAQLAQALARWEPELEADSARKQAPKAEPEPADDDEEIEDELDLLLSDDDVVGAAAPATPAASGPAKKPVSSGFEPMADDELDPELAELLGPDLGEPDLKRPHKSRSEGSAPKTKAERDRLDGEVNAALGSGPEAKSLIDLKDTFGADADDDLSGQELEAVFDDAFGDGVPIGGPAPAKSGQGAAGRSERDAYPPGDRSPRAPQNDSDMAGLTLHPMFFEQDANAEVPGLGKDEKPVRKEERHDRWSMSGDER